MTCDDCGGEHGRDERCVWPTPLADNAYAMVTCKDCGKHYRCTPAADYYNATTDADGVCETCLLTTAGIHPDAIETLPRPT